MTTEAARGLLFVLSGPSGVGKDKVLEILAERRFPITRVITVVTRTLRPDELDGVHYHKRTPDQFDEMVRQRAFLEWTRYADKHYGTPRESVRQALLTGSDALLKIEIDGFRAVRQVLPETISIFLRPPSLDALERRLRNRQDPIPEAEIQARLARARIELPAAAEYDYTVVNEEGQAERAADLVAAIVTAERARTQPRMIVLDP